MRLVLGGYLEVKRKKMQKKCKKMQIYLHIWKIFCTFASDLGIVPAVTIRYHRVMKKVCVFRCQSNGEVWKVYRVDIALPGQSFSYRVYCGRKWIAKVSFFDKGRAIASCVSVCTGCVLQKVEGTEA